MGKPRILVYMHYLEIGGAERALIGLLNTLDPERVDVDLFLNQHTGEFMPLIPKHVRLLPAVPQYTAIERPISDIVREGHIGIALRRLVAKWRHQRYISQVKKTGEVRVDNSPYLYIMQSVLGALPTLDHFGEYDLAISFLQPHCIVRDKVNARKKVCWIHTDYSTVHINDKMELPVWGAFDRIAAISDEASRAFAKRFPTLADKLMTIENILSPDSIRRQADMEDVSAEMPMAEGELRILSIGRYCAAKRFDDLPRICRRLIDRGLRFKWYIVGFGDDSTIRQNMAKCRVGDHLVLLGKKANPYPYIKACDIYAQPSLYEGKSVTVREAQILCRPAVVSAYPTAASQIVDGVDGRIVPLDIDACADGIYDFAVDDGLRSRIAGHLQAHDYGNESEVQKIYRLADS